MNSDQNECDTMNLKAKMAESDTRIHRKENSKPLSLPSGNWQLPSTEFRSNSHYHELDQPQQQDDYHFILSTLTSGSSHNYEGGSSESGVDNNLPPYLPFHIGLGQT